MLARLIPACSILAISLFAQDAKPADDKPAPAPKNFLVEIGTHIPLSLINSVSTKNSVPGDRVYLETVFPILVDGQIVIPPGSYVSGTITEVQRPGKVKGRGEFHLRFDSLTLPNGTTRDFRARVSGLDGRASEELDRKEGTIKSEGNKGGRRSNGRRNRRRRRQRRRAGRKHERRGRNGRGHRRGGRRDRRIDRRPVHPRSRSGARQRHYARNGARSPSELRGERTGFFEFAAAPRLGRRPGSAAE